jgi:hypothetical protein
MSRIPGHQEALTIYREGKMPFTPKDRIGGMEALHLILDLSAVHRFAFYDYINMAAWANRYLRFRDKGNQQADQQLMGK